MKVSELPEPLLVLPGQFVHVETGLGTKCRAAVYIGGHNLRTTQNTAGVTINEKNTPEITI